MTSALSDPASIKIVYNGRRPAARLYSPNSGPPLHGRGLALAEGPVLRPPDWRARVNRLQSAAEKQALSLSRDGPFGAADWQASHGGGARAGKDVSPARLAP